MNSMIRSMSHVAQEPLKIEREFSAGVEYILIEGVRYSAEYFRMLACPDTDMLYSIRRDDDTVWLTVIRTPEEARKFFDEVGRGDLAPTEEPNDGL